MAHPLLSRMWFSKIVFVIFIISLVWTVAIFLAPATLSPGKVEGLDGKANSIDYGETWADLPPPHAAVYYIGDAECHQMSDRSFYVAGNQMPICARDTAIFLFGTLGLLTAMVARQGPSVTRMLLGMCPKKGRDFIERKIPEIWFLVILAAVFLVPMALDAGLQLFTAYESNNALRFLTGALAGWFGGFVLAALIISTKVVTSVVSRPSTTDS